MGVSPIAQDVAAAGILGENKVRHVIHDIAQQVALVPESVFHFLQNRDVTRNAKRADQVAILVTKRRFGGQHPDGLPVHLRLPLDLVNDRRPAFHDPPLVIKAFPGLVTRMKLEVGLPNRLRRIVQPEIMSQRLVDAQKPALFVLEIDMVGTRFEHRAQKERIGGRRGGSHRQILRPNARSAPAKDFPEFLIRMGHNPDVFFLSSLPCEPLSLR